MQSHVTAIIQARMSSSRLPGKVLKDIGGKTMLEMVVERARAAHLVTEVVVATSTDKTDDPIVEKCNELQIPVVRGSLDDVLSRYATAARAYPAPIYVRLTADCPLLDPEVIDKVIGEYRVNAVDYAANRMPTARTYPIGLDVEVFSASFLAEADREGKQGYQREHVTPYMYDCSSIRPILHVESGVPNVGHERWTVDTEEDLELVRSIIDVLGPEIRPFEDIVRFLSTRPDLKAINSNIRQKSFRE